MEIMSKDFVLVVGAVHIDVIADYASSNANVIDKIGDVRYAIGGTGYNIATDLAQAYVPTFFYSFVRKGSFSSIWIKTRLLEAGVNMKFLQDNDRVDEGGFIAIRKDHELETAVTSTLIESIPLSKELVEKAIDESCLVVADCNLSVDQLSLVVEVANSYKHPILIAGVSDSKARRILELPEKAKVSVFSLSEAEFQTIEPKLLSSLTHEDISRLCELTHSRHIVVTLGDRGYMIMSETGQMLKFEAPKVNRLVSSTGAGDALIAGIALHWYEDRSFDWNKAHTVIGRIVRKVLQEEGATQGSLAKEIDFAALAKTALRESQQSIYTRIMQSHLVPWFTILGAIAALVALFLSRRN
jgi:sugar/nucleoside kinase (ribokinase family)